MEIFNRLVSTQAYKWDQQITMLRSESNIYTKFRCVASMSSCSFQHLSTVNAAELYVLAGRLEKLYKTLSKEE